MLTDEPAVLTQFDPIGIGADLDRATDGMSIGRIPRLSSKRASQVFDTDAGSAWEPSTRPE